MYAIFLDNCHILLQFLYICIFLSGISLNVKLGCAELFQIIESYGI